MGGDQCAIVLAPWCQEGAGGAIARVYMHVQLMLLPISISFGV